MEKRSIYKSLLCNIFKGKDKKAKSHYNLKKYHAKQKKNLQKLQKKYNLHNIRKIYRKTSLKSMDKLYFFSVRKMQNYNLFIPPVEF